jgi:hypothetical protein
MNERKLTMADTHEDPTKQLASLGRNPEQIFDLIRGAVSKFVAAKQRVGQSSAGKTVNLGITIPSPESDVINEISRYATEALIKHADSRTWCLLKVSEMSPGDVFTVYDLINKKPVTREVTALTIESVGRERKVRYSMRNGDHGEVRASEDYLFYVHRQTVDEVRNHLRMELAADEAGL